MLHHYDFTTLGAATRGWIGKQANRFRLTSIANLLGFAIKMGVNMSPMQVANNAKEASSNPPSAISRCEGSTFVASTHQKPACGPIDSLWNTVSRVQDNGRGYASLLHPRGFTQELPSVTPADRCTIRPDDILRTRKMDC
jgi:hypothetical protein